MLTDLRIVLPNRPGTLTRFLEALAEAGLNLEGMSGDIRPGETWGFIHLVVEDCARAKEIAEDMGLQITSEHEVEMTTLDNRPGALAETLRAYREREENIEVIYFGSNNQLVVGSESMRKEKPGVRVEDAEYR
jgi:hypothetical protein